MWWWFLIPVLIILIIATIADRSGRELRVDIKKYPRNRWT